MSPFKLNGPAARVGVACARAAARRPSPSSPAAAAAMRPRPSQIAGPSRRAYASPASPPSSSSSTWSAGVKGRAVALSALSLLSAAAYLSLAQRVELDAPPARQPGLTETLRLIAAKEVMAHTAEDDCWVIIHNPKTGQDDVWDVSEFIELHPGGAEVILSNSGRDAT
jgi:L-lactate dehydrogenase (cytochrome)